MIKNIVFQCRIEGVNCINEVELTKYVESMIAHLRAKYPTAMIDQQLQCEVEEPGVQRTAFGDAQVDGYMEVKRQSTGEVEHFYNVNGQSFPITKEQYDAAHASPEMQRQLESARKAAGLTH